MASVNPNQVKNIIDTELNDSEIEGAISTAVTIVDNHLVSPDLSSGIRVEITMYLAAHFVAVRDKTVMIKSEKIGDASVTYDVGNREDAVFSFTSTKWGATAVALDSSNVLGQLGQKKPRLVSLDLDI